MFASQKAASFNFTTGHGGRRSMQKRMQQQPQQQITPNFRPQQFLGVRNKQQRKQSIKHRTSIQHVGITRGLQSVGASNLVSKNYLISVTSGSSQTDATLAFSLSIVPQPGEQARFLEISKLYHSVLNVIELSNQSTSQIAATFELCCDQLGGFIDQNNLDTKVIAIAYQYPKSVMPSTTFNGVNVVWASDKSYGWDVTNINTLHFRIRHTSSSGSTMVTFPISRPVVVNMTITSVVP